MKDIEFLSIEMPEHIAHIRTKYASFKLEQLIEERKRMAADKTTAANLARTMFEFGLELTEGKFKQLNDKYPKYVKAVGYETVDTMVKKIVDNQIKDVLVRKYKRAFDFGATYKGASVSEMQALEHLVAKEAEDDNLSPEEILNKYAIPERVAELKRLAYNNKVAELELNYRVCKVLYAMHRKSLEVMDVLIAERKMAETRDFMSKTAEWLNPEGRKLFGL
jgi:hypothetical protein